MEETARASKRSKNPRPRGFNGYWYRASIFTMLQLPTIEVINSLVFREIVKAEFFFFYYRHDSGGIL